MNTLAINAYAKNEIDEAVSGASPHQLIIMLYEGAIRFISQAKGHIEAKRVGQKGECISKALGIIDLGLRAALDKSGGGEIAQNLDNLYIYMGNALLYANLEDDIARLEEVSKLLKDLKSAWEAIGKRAPIVALTEVQVKV